MGLTNIRETIARFFERRSFSRKELTKIRARAMKRRIRLRGYRARFCGKCLTDLRTGKIGVTKTHKTTRCSSCGHQNKIRIS